MELEEKVAAKGSTGKSFVARRLPPPRCMFDLVDPDCPECGSKVRDTVSEFYFSGEELPTLENAVARITGHKCGCGHKFIVVTYRSSERRKTSCAADQE